MRSVLVGSDLGPGSDAVVRGAAALALGSGATLHVVHALGLIGLPLREAVTSLQGGAVDRARNALQAQVDRVLAGCADTAVPAVDYQSPHLAILARAKALDAGVVVLGTARQPFAGDHLPGVTVSVAARGDLPVLVLREPFHWAPRSVLLPMDEPHESGERLRQACDWLHHACPGSSAHAGRGEPMDLLVLHPPETRDGSPDPDTALAREARRACGPGLRITGIRDPEHGRASMSPADRILDFAERNAIDLILLGRRDDASTPLPERTWYQVLLRAPCAVCLLPGTGSPTAQPVAPSFDGTLVPEDETVLAVGT